MIRFQSTGAPLEQRFWDKAALAFNAGDECWIWLGGADACGYGRFTDKTREHRRTMTAHRWAWTFAYGPIPEGLCVLHHCDVPPCVNPNHLFLGTPLDNARDKVAKGRLRVGHVQGEQNGQAKLTEADVRFIRSTVATGVPQARMVERFGVSPMTVSQVVTRKTWRHVA